MENLERSLIGLLAVLLFSCQFENQKAVTSSSSAVTSRPNNSDEVSSISQQDSNDRDPAKDKALAVKNVKTSLEQRMTEKPELREVIKKILMQPEKFGELAEACAFNHSPKKYYPTNMEFTDFFKVSNEKYILHLQCYSGAYQPGGVYFLCSKKGGIQTKPLILARLIGCKTGKCRETPISDKDSQAIGGYYKFDNEKKELSLTQRCDGPWSCFGISRYAFVNNQLVLQEYIIGSRDKRSKDIRYTTSQFIRSQQGWVSSGVMKCKEIGLEDCTKATKP